jgi:outer membrane protein assembly factor BamC
VQRSIGLVLLVLVIGAGGCARFSDDKGFFVDRSDDYLKAGENAPLVIPEDLETTRVQDPFPIPKITDRLRPEYYPKRPPRPDAIYANDNRDDVRIQRLGERRWLVIPEPPTVAWPKVRQFLAENGVEVEWEAPSQGRLDTRWLEIANQPYRDVVRQLIRDGKESAQLTGGTDRLRLRVEPGLRERSSEVHIRYENSEFSTPSPDGLADLRTTPSHVSSIEHDALNELGAYIAARVAEQTVSMVAQDIGAGVKSFLDIDANGDPLLRLVLDYERAWATVGQSLSRASIDVIDSNQQAGTYLISVPENLNVEAPEKGFFRRMFSFGGGDGMLDLQLKLEEGREGTYELTALDAAGKRLDREFGQQVLVLLREYAS